MKKANNYLLKCPICNKKIWYQGTLEHKKYKHSALSDKDFERMIIDSIKSGTIIPKVFEEPNKNLVTGTSRMNYERKHNKLGIRSIVSGGKTK